MGWKHIYVLVLPLVAACSNAPPTVYSHLDLAGEKPSGNIRPISQYLSTADAKTTVFLLHGVNDHCPGYGIDPSYGWLNNKNLSRLGLLPRQTVGALGNTTYREFKLLDSGFSDAKNTEISKITVRVQDYSFSQKMTPAILEVVEITWSEMTQWIKNKQIGNDYQNPEETSAKLNEDPSLYCLREITNPNARPPKRSLVNRLLKEHTLDRALIDAVIYSGAYGVRIQNGLADALCGALTPGWTQPAPAPSSQTKDVRCDWSKIHIPENSKFLFVTHSLGSRILYDTLLGLMKTQIRPGVDPFPEGYTDRSDPVVNAIMIRTPIIYMMANQLPFIGLTNVPLDYDLWKPPFPMQGPATTSTELEVRANELNLSKPLEIKAEVVGEALLPRTTPNTFQERCENAPTLNLLAEKRSVAAPSASTLEVVAFSDTDDLLSWPIPSWYMSRRECSSKLNIVNAYVQNTPRWLGLLSNPAAAHGGYFYNPQVWELMRCGAIKGELTQC